MQLVKGMLVIVIAVTFSLSGLSVSHAQTESKLHELDLLAASPQPDPITSTQLLTAVLHNAHNTEIRSLETDKDFVDTSAANSNLKRPSAVFSDEDLAQVFNKWVVTIGGSEDLKIDPNQVRFYRNFLANFVPHFVPRTNQGQVAAQLSSAQFTYFLDRFIANGGVPYVARTTAVDTADTKEASLTAIAKEAARREKYDQALEAYRSKTPLALRVADMRKFLELAPVQSAVGN